MGWGGGGAKTYSVIVDPAGGVDYTTIAAAVADAGIQATGGTIILREGTYTQIATVTLPLKPIVVKGEGEWATIIEVGGAQNFPVFTLPTGVANTTPFVCEDIRFNSASAVAGSKVATTATSSWDVKLVRCLINNLDSILDGTSPVLSMLLCRQCNVNKIMVPSSGTGVFRATDCSFNMLASAQVILGNVTGPLTALASVQGSVFNNLVDYFSMELGFSRFFGTNLVGVRANLRGANSTFQGCRIDGDAANTAASLVILNDRVEIDGCMFQTGQAGVEIQGRVDCILSNNIFRDLSVRPWKETSGANRNRFDGNLVGNFILPTVIGADSIWDAGNIRTVTGTTLLDERHRTVLADAAGAAFDVDLPPAAQAKHRIYTIKRINGGANAVTIDPDGAELIDGAASATLAAQYDGMTIESDGTGWHILSRT